MPPFLLRLAVAIAFITTVTCSGSLEFYDYNDKQCTGPSKISHAIRTGRDPGCEELSKITDVLKNRWVKLKDVPDQCQVFYYTRFENQLPREPVCRTLQYAPPAVRNTCTLAQHLTGLRYYCLQNTTISTSKTSCPEPSKIDHTFNITWAGFRSGGEKPICYKIPSGARTFVTEGWSSLLSASFYEDEECGKTDGGKEIIYTTPSLKSCSVRDQTLILKEHARSVEVTWNEGWHQ